MIIQCEQCQTKFRLDDSRVKNAGVKVRCAKCKHIFTVKKELPDTLSQPSFAARLDQSTGFTNQTPPVSPFAPEPESIAAEPAQDFMRSAAMDSTLFELPEVGSPFSAMPATESGFSAKSEWEHALNTDKTPFPDIESDFAGYDNGNAPTDADTTAKPPIAFSESTANFPFQIPDIPTDVACQLPDFSDSSAGPDVTEEKMSAPKVIDAGAFSFGVINAAPEPVPTTLTQMPEEPATAQTPPVTSREEQQQTESVPEAGEELPPLSISSRRKQGPLVKVLLAITVLVGAAILYFYGSSLLPLISQKTAPEQAKIILRSIDASFVKNASIGELLIISGEAVNSSTTPQTAIQVQGVVYGDNNQVLTSKNAFIGNILSKEQLATMPMDKIEAAMANQFGGSLDNLEVAPGKAVPFMIVITKLPEGAKNFGAFPVGSAAVTKPKP